MSGTTVITKNIQGPKGAAGTNAPPAGTGFVHVTGGAQDANARAVNVGTSDVTGVLAIVNGGTGLSSIGAAGTVLTSTGGGAMWAASIAASLLPNIAISGDVAASGSGGSLAATVVALRGNAVAASTPTTGEVLTWNGAAWDAESAPGITSLTNDVLATGPGAAAATVVALQGHAVASTAPTNGQVLAWNTGGSQWQPTTLTLGLDQLTGDVTAGPGSGSQAATVVKLQGNAVSATAPTDGYVLTWSSGASAWGPAPASGGTGLDQLTGDVTAGPGTGSQVATVVGIQGWAVPDPSGFSASTYLEWTGSALSWTTISGGSGITQLAGDVLAGPGSGSVSATVDGIQGNAVTNPASSPANSLLEWNGGALDWNKPGGDVYGSIGVLAIQQITGFGGDCEVFARLTSPGGAYIQFVAGSNLELGGSTLTSFATTVNWSGLTYVATVEANTGYVRMEVAGVLTDFLVHRSS